MFQTVVRRLFIPVVICSVAAACAEQHTATPIEPQFTEDPANVPCQAAEAYDPKAPTCTLEGIEVYAPPQNVPIPDFPPPEPPLIVFPPYTPSGDGFNPITHAPGSTEAIAPEIEGDWQEGPVAFLACLLGVMAVPPLTMYPELLTARNEFHAALGEMNLYEYEFNIRMANQSQYSETELAQHQTARNITNARYQEKKEKLYQEIKKAKSITFLAFTSAILSCAPGAWLPIV
jgi:hypothetical protein